jgi:hypothetical protein
MWGNIVAIHSVLKKKNYKAKFSTSSIYIKKNRQRQFWKKNKKIIKKEKKTMWGNTVAIHSVLKKKLQS